MTILGPILLLSVAHATSAVPSCPQGTNYSIADAAGEPVGVAIVVGIQCYAIETKEPLKYAANDANLVATTLQRRGYTVIALTDVVDKADIDRALDDAEARASTGNLIFYYAGHGALSRDRGQLERYLMTSSAMQEAEGYPVVDVLDRLERMDAGRRYVIFDTCYAGEGVRSWSGRSPSTRGWFDRPATRPIPATDAWFFSSDYYQLAQESAKLGDGHGVYTWHFVEALAGESAADVDLDGSTNLLEAHHYAQGRTRASTSGQQPLWRIGRRTGHQAATTAEARGVFVVPAWPDSFRLVVDGEDVDHSSTGGLIAVDPGQHELQLCWHPPDQYSDGCEGEAIVVARARPKVDSGQWSNLHDLYREGADYLVAPPAGRIGTQLGVTAVSGEGLLANGTTLLTAGFWRLPRASSPVRITQGLQVGRSGGLGTADGVVYTHLAGRLGAWWHTQSGFLQSNLGPFGGVRFVERHSSRASVWGTVGTVGAHVDLGLVRGPLFAFADAELFGFVDPGESSRFRAVPSVTAGGGAWW